MATAHGASGASRLWRMGQRLPDAPPTGLAPTTALEMASAGRIGEPGGLVQEREGPR